MRLAFFGTPDFAVPALNAVLEHCDEHGDECVLVVCQPDRKKGRGKKMLPPPVKVRAEEAGIRVLQPETLKKGTPAGDAFFEGFLDLDLAVVAAYGRILPGRILRMPQQGFVNVHGSLLPRWRGAAPVQRALQAGDTETGIGLMDMVFALDAGDVYVEATTPIREDDNSATLSTRLAGMGHDLLREHLPALLQGSLEKKPQREGGLTYAKMLQKEEGRLDFTLPARVVFHTARAMFPWPGSFTTLGKDTIKLFSPMVAEGRGPPGAVLSTQAGLVIACGEGAIAFAEIQLPGKKRIRVSDYVRAKPIDVGTLLGADPA